MKRLQLLFSASLMVLALGFTACEGDKGEEGPAGTPGTTGATGVKGDTGAKGEKGDQGEGFSEATSFGNILVTLKGITYEDAPYSKTLDFKYIPEFGGLYSSSYNNYNNIFSFYLERQFKNSATNARTTDSGNNTIEISARVENGQVIVQNFSLRTQFIHEGKIQGAYDDYYEGENNEDKSISITNYSFDASTNSLKFDFTYNYGETTISGKVDTKIFEGSPA